MSMQNTAVLAVSAGHRLIVAEAWQHVPVDESTLRELIADVTAGTISADEAVAALRRLPFADVGDALVDHHRALRVGIPETVFGPGKSPEQCARIVAELLEHGTGPVLVTRVSAEQVKAVEAHVGPGSGRHPEWHGLTAAGCLLYRAPAAERDPNVVVVTAGTSDGPVADECALTLRAYGFAPRRVTDVGVAGLHRLLASLDDVTSADAVVVIAGMEGALASVVGGLTAAPVVAVPTSVGYGSSLEGVTALLAMLASCASGVTVVGIDNGFGAACAVARLLR
jgi:NCAIR mutase (PurE)-related protein